MPLKADYKDFIAPDGVRKYNLIYNSDGTVTLRDVTVYEQEGDYLSASVVNTTNTEANAIAAAVADKANKSKSYSFNIPATWSTSSPYEISVTVEGITATTNAILSPQSTVTKAQLEAFAAALMVVYSQGENTMTLRAFGDKPTVAIPVTVMILG